PPAEGADAKGSARGDNARAGQKPGPARRGPKPEWKRVGQQRLERLGARNVPARRYPAHGKRPPPAPPAPATPRPAGSRVRAVADEFPVGRAGVVDGAVEVIEVAQRLLGALGIESLLAPEQRVDRVLAIVEARDRRSQLLGRAAVAAVEALPHALDPQPAVGDRIRPRDPSRPVEVVRTRQP